MEGRSSDRRRVSERLPFLGGIVLIRRGDTRPNAGSQRRRPERASPHRPNHRAQYSPFQVATVPIPEVNDVRPVPAHSNRSVPHRKVQHEQPSHGSVWRAISGLPVAGRLNPTKGDVRRQQSNGGERREPVIADRDKSTSQSGFEGVRASNITGAHCVHSSGTPARRMSE